MTKILALLGFAPTEEQARIPPMLAWLGLLTCSYFAAAIVDLVAGLLGSWGVYLRIPGVFCSLLVAHAIVRHVVFSDALSWGGWIRDRVK